MNQPKDFSAGDEDVVSRSRDGGDHGKCNFTQVLGQQPGAVALYLDNKVVGWKMDLASSIAIMPAECF